MGRKPSRGHVFVETDGQVYLVRDRGTLRFPRVGETLPFPTEPNGVMDFGDDRVLRQKPLLDHHPEEWFGRDAIFERSDVDPLVKRAIYTTMIRCVSEVILPKGPRALMVKAVRGFSKGYWNVPGGFMDYGEGPEVGVEREAEEEIGVDIVLDGLLNVYVSGFPGKPAYTLGFVYKGHLDSEAFRLKPDEIEDAAWFTVDKALTLTRNPFAKWALVDFFLQSNEARAALKVKRHGLAPHASGSNSPTVFLDRDGVINRGRPGMLLAAARDLGVRPRGAWIVGDKPSDVETGRAFGCRTAWVGPKSWRKRFAAEVRPLSPDVVADGLLEAARTIVRYSEDPVAEAARKSVADPTITS